MRQELAESEEQRIEQARKANLAKPKVSKEYYEVEPVKPIHQRTEHLLDSKKEKLKVAAQRVELDRKLAEVEAEFRAQIEEQLIRGGPEAAERYQKTIAADETELHQVLLRWAADELTKEKE